MTKGLIFDMDGVLIDSEPLYKELNSKLFNKLGFSLTDKEYAEFVGTTDEKMLSDLKRRFALEQSVGELNQLREEIHMSFFKLATLTPMEHLLDLLKWAKARKLKLAVASSTDEKFVFLILEKIGILDYFQTVVCGNHIKHSKPAPDIFLKAAKDLGLKTHECIVIEDSSNGVKAGKKAGMFVIGFQSDDGSQNLRESNQIVYSLKETIKAIKEHL